MLMGCVVCVGESGRVGGLGGCEGPIPKGLLRVSNRLEWCSRRIQHCSICSNGIGFFVGGSISISSKGAVEAESGGTL